MCDARWGCILQGYFPTKNTLCGERGQSMCCIFVIAVDVNFGAKKHGLKFFECFNNRQKFFFDGCAILLSFVWFLGMECNWFVVLFDDSAKLKI